MRTISRPSLWSSAETPPPRRRRDPQPPRGADIDIRRLLRHDLDSCAEFALAHCLGKRRSACYSASYLTRGCISSKMPIEKLELLAKYNLVDAECGLRHTIGDVQMEHEPIYDEYFDFFLERCTRTDGLWIQCDSFCENWRETDWENYTNIFRFLLSHLPDPVPAYLTITMATGISPHSKQPQSSAMLKLWRCS
ncbi:hypothetical protein DFS34DRAFT_382120 [Phlyctochytrium arcticum]|nr:hypothetical protein DFS34DRAFT_382120 [Phlyctochytrium arcticum]